MSAPGRSVPVRQRGAVKEIRNGRHAAHIGHKLVERNYRTEYQPCHCGVQIFAGLSLLLKASLTVPNSADAWSAYPHKMDAFSKQVRR